MNKIVKQPLETLFNIVTPLLKPASVQILLRNLGLKIPYRLAKKLNYKGIVDFSVNDKILKLKSHNTPIEIFIFWYGIFGIWEATQLRIWSRLVNQSDIVLDVGANTGVYSLIASTNSAAKIFAFEPVPDVRVLLEETIKLNKLENVEVISSAVGNRNGLEKIYVPRSGWVDTSSLNKEFAKNFVESNGTMSEFTIPVVTIASFLKERKVSPGCRILCKIDVEGFEEEVVQGMLEALKIHNIIFTLELLTKEQFIKVCSNIPKQYNIYSINEKTHKLEKTINFNTHASNYLFSLSDPDMEMLN